MTHKSVFALLLGTAVVAGGCQKKDAAPKAAASPAATMTEDERAIYALGAALGQQAAQQVKPLELSPAETEALKKGLAASLAGETPQYTMQQYGDKLRARADARSATAAAGEKQRSVAFRERAAAEEGALTLPSGLVYRTIRAGKGPTPRATDVVRVHYHGTLTCSAR